jgi:hypothetical protein
VSGSGRTIEIGGAYSVQTHKVLHLTERHQLDFGLTSYEKNISFIDLGGRGCDASVERSANIPGSNHGYATNIETQGGADPDFSAAKDSTDPTHNGNE